MSDFELTRAGDGNYELSGEMSFDTVDRILEASKQAFQGYEEILVDLTRVTRADSAGLALLLEWKAQANIRAGQVRFSGIPNSIRAIADTTGVAHLIS